MITGAELDFKTINTIVTMNLQKAYAELSNGMWMAGKRIKSQRERHQTGSY